MNETDVADFLLNHPDFFGRHAELLGRIRLANPHGGRAISLPERQIEMLREKNRQLERRLSELVRYGHENDGHAAKFDRWAARILAERDPMALPDAVAQGLRDIFDVPQAALRIWHVAPAFASLPAARLAGADIERHASGMGTPYCGPNTGFAAAAWLADNGVPPVTESMAMIPMRTTHGAHEGAFGLLVMGSPDSQRFHGGMSTDLLIRLGALAGAALSRLLAETP